MRQHRLRLPLVPLTAVALRAVLVRQLHWLIELGVGNCQLGGTFVDRGLPDSGPLAEVLPVFGLHEPVDCFLSVLEPVLAKLENAVDPVLVELLALPFEDRFTPLDAQPEIVEGLVIHDFLLVPLDEISSDLLVLHLNIQRLVDLFRLQIWLVVCLLDAVVCLPGFFPLLDAMHVGVVEDYRALFSVLAFELVLRDAARVASNGVLLGRAEDVLLVAVLQLYGLGVLVPQEVSNDSIIFRKED